VAPLTAAPENHCSSQTCLGFDFVIPSFFQRDDSMIHSGHGRAKEAASSVTSEASGNSPGWWVVVVVVCRRFFTSAALPT
jgi:hypothetical protein